MFPTNIYDAEEYLQNFVGKEMSADKLFEYILDSEEYDIIFTIYSYLDLILEQPSNYIKAVRNEVIRISNKFSCIDSDRKEVCDELLLLIKE